VKVVAGLAEIVLWVRDMEAGLHFYRDLFGLEVISPPELPNKFLKAGDGADGVPEMIVLVPHADRSSEFPREKAKRVLHHLAFLIEASAYEGMRERFIAAGVEVRSGIHPVLKGVRTFYVVLAVGLLIRCAAGDPRPVRVRRRRSLAGAGAGAAGHAVRTAMAGSAGRARRAQAPGIPNAEAGP